MYGVEFLRTFDPEDEEHQARKHRLFELPSGPKLLPDAFDCILARVRLDPEIDLMNAEYVRAGCEGQGIDGLQSQVLYRSHELVNVVGFRGRGLVLSWRRYCTEMDRPERRSVY